MLVIVEICQLWFAVAFSEPNFVGVGANIVHNSRGLGFQIYNLFMHTTLCLKKIDTDVAHYNFNAHQPILVIFGRGIAEWISY